MKVFKCIKTVKYFHSTYVKDFEFFTRGKYYKQREAEDLEEGEIELESNKGYRFTINGEEDFSDHFEEVEAPLDALGEPILIGSEQLYGFAYNKNGFNTVIIGKPIKITPKGLITLEVSNQKSSVYDNPLKNNDKHMKTTSVKSFMLFKV